MSRKTLSGLVVAFAALALMLSNVAAAVTFDASTGTGFVGKGDVQTALNLNNAGLQAAASSLTFSYESVDVYSATCTWVTGEGTRGEQTHDVSIPRHTTVNDTVSYDKRTHQQGDGFFLTGFGSTSTTGTVPVVGDQCVSGESSGGNGQDGTWTAVTLVSSSGGVLSVNGVPLQ